MGNTSKKKILLVDDDEIGLIITENFLKRKYEIITARSGKEALDHLLKGLVPDLVLLDIIMPNMDGWETYNRIKVISFLNDVPVIFLTSISSDFEKNLAVEMGANDYIIKPYEPKDLLKRIRKAMRT